MMALILKNMTLVLNRRRTYLVIGVMLLYIDEASTDDFEDEDLKSSAIYQVDLPAAIKQFVKESHQLDPNGFQSTSQFLSHHHKLLLEELISK